MKKYKLLITTALLTLNVMAADALQPITDEVREQLNKLSSEASALFHDVQDEGKRKDAISSFCLLIDNAGYYATHYQSAGQLLKTFKDMAIDLWEEKNPNRSRIMHQFLSVAPDFLLDHVKWHLMNCGEDFEGGEISKALLMRLLDRNIAGTKEFVAATLRYGVACLGDIAENPNNPEWMHKINTLAWLAWSFGWPDGMLDNLKAQYHAARDLYFPRDDEETEYNDLNRELCFNSESPKLHSYHASLLSKRPICWREKILGHTSRHPLRDPLIAYNGVLRDIFLAAKGYNVWETGPATVGSQSK